MSRTRRYGIGWSATGIIGYMKRDDGYLLDNQRVEAGLRFDALAELFDPWTFRTIEKVGIAAGWRCWEVGAGGPSVPRWLAGRVGGQGRVLATDIDVSWARQAASSVVEIRHHDVAHDEPPAETFDLIHARLVLVHLPDRDTALQSMIKILRRGGTLLIEDADPALQPLACPDEHGPEQQLANKLRNGFRKLLAGRGADLAYGRKLPRLLREAGLSEVRAEAFFPMTSPACGLLEAATITQLRDELIDHHYATAADIDRHLASIAAGHIDFTTAPMISAWGRRPQISADNPQDRRGPDHKS